jgi:hypothetical protein
MLTATVDTRITDVLAESFALSNDGYWYPIEASPERPALVRVIVAKSGYCVERRREVGVAWLPVATVTTAEFHPPAFRRWRAAWRMTA